MDHPEIYRGFTINQAFRNMQNNVQGLVQEAHDMANAIGQYEAELALLRTQQTRFHQRIRDFSNDLTGSARQAIENIPYSTLYQRYPQFFDQTDNTQQTEHSRP